MVSIFSSEVFLKYIHCFLERMLLHSNRLQNSVNLTYICTSAGKESACNAGDLGLIPGLGRCPREGKGYPLQYSGLENSMNYSPWGHRESNTTEQLSLSLSNHICTGKPKTLSDSLYCNIRFILVVQNHTHNVSEVRLYLWVKLLSHMVILYLPFWGTVKLFSTVATAFYIPISNVLRFQFLHILIGI